MQTSIVSAIIPPSLLDAGQLKGVRVADTVHCGVRARQGEQAAMQGLGKEDEEGVEERGWYQAVINRG